MKLRRISSSDLRSHPDQTADWLNRLNERLEQIERRLEQLERE